MRPASLIRGGSCARTEDAGGDWRSGSPLQPDAVAIWSHPLEAPGTDV